MTTAYTFVAIAAMISEINYSASSLGLAVSLPVQGSAITLQYLSDPTVTSFGGTIELTDFAFCFGCSGRLKYIARKINRFEALTPDALSSEVRRGHLSSPDALWLATNWLRAISVDTTALSAKYNPRVVRAPLFVGGRRYPASSQGDDYAPIVRVEWGEARLPAVRVSIYAPTRELLGIYQQDESFSTRPQINTSMLHELVTLSDSDFCTMSRSQRSDLVRRFISGPTSTTVERPRAPGPSALTSKPGAMYQ